MEKDLENQKTQYLNLKQNLGTVPYQAKYFSIE